MRPLGRLQRTEDTRAGATALVEQAERQDLAELRPVATRRPSRVTSRAVKESSWRAVTSTADRTVEKVASTPQ